MFEVQLVNLSVEGWFMEEKFEMENFRENLRLKQEMIE